MGGGVWELAQTAPCTAGSALLLRHSWALGWGRGGGVCAEKGGEAVRCPHLPASLFLASRLLINHFPLVAAEVNTSPELRKPYVLPIQRTGGLGFGVGRDGLKLRRQIGLKYPALPEIMIWNKRTTDASQKVIKSSRE